MPESDLELLIRAARQAGDIALGYFGRKVRTWNKGDGAGPVTEADIAVDDFLKSFLLAARPDHGWLSEETEDSPDRASRSRVFVVDPIDGTRSFAAGQRTWAHSLAIVEDGRPVAGVIFLPARDKIYAATPALASKDGRPIAASRRADMNRAEILAHRALSDPANWRGEVPAFSRHFRPSLAYRLALVAEGRFDAMVTLRPAWEWDIAAGVLIAEAAGARVTDRKGRAIRFNRPDARSLGVLAAGKPVHSDLVARLEAARGAV